MDINTEHVAALMRNYRTAHPSASTRLAADYAAERYVDSFARLAHSSQATVDRTYDMVYTVGISL